MAQTGNVGEVVEKCTRRHHPKLMPCERWMAQDGLVHAFPEGLLYEVTLHETENNRASYRGL